MPAKEIWARGEGSGQWERITPGTSVSPGSFSHSGAFFQGARGRLTCLLDLNWAAKIHGTQLLPEVEDGL